MCVPCCNRGEQWYLTQEGKVKPEFLKTFSETAHAEEREDKSDWGKTIFELRGFYPTVLLVVDGDKEHQLCQCPCHQQNSMVMH